MNNFSADMENDYIRAIIFLNSKLRAAADRIGVDIFPIILIYYNLLYANNQTTY